MRGVISSLPNTPPWRGAQLKKIAQGKFYIYLSSVSSGGLLR
jgi:hypothetical protein